MTPDIPVLKNKVLRWHRQEFADFTRAACKTSSKTSGLATGTAEPNIGPSRSCRFTRNGLATIETAAIRAFIEMLYPMNHKKLI